jgi:fimbrial chaperone protein
MQQGSRTFTGGSPLLAALLGLALGQAEPSFAATLGISPARIVLSSSSRSALVTLTNQTDEETRVEVSVAAWSDAVDGTPILEPSEDLSVFPLIVAIPPHGEKRIRVGRARREPVVTERAYRLFLQELPPSKATATQTGVRMVMRFALPVYVQPAKPAPSVSAEGFVVEGGHVRFQLVNAGNAHARMEAATLTGKGPAGDIVFTKNLEVRALLAGGRRDFDVPLSPDECRPSAMLELRMGADGKAISTGANLQAASCGG